MSPTCPLCHILDHTSHYIQNISSWQHLHLPFLSHVLHIMFTKQTVFLLRPLFILRFFPAFPCPVNSFIFSSVSIRKKPGCTFAWFPFNSSVFDLVVLCDLESPPTNFQTCHLQYSKIATVVFHFLSLYYFTFLYYSQYFVTLSEKSSVRIVTRYPFCCAICTNICPRCTDIASELKRQNYKQLLTIRTNKVFYRLKISSIHFLFCEILILSLM